MSILAELRDVTKTYRVGQEDVFALRGVNLSISTREYIALVGPSGSGKTTLMNIVGCLDRPTSGSYELLGRDVLSLGDAQLAEVRSDQIGFVFQSFNLIPHLTALDNVRRALIYKRAPRQARSHLARAALDRVWLSDRLSHLPSELSGGQRQRVAIARALCTRPRLLIADEPTGNLDSVVAAQIMSLFDELNQEGTTIIIVTHDRAVASHCHRQIELLDGIVI